MKRAGFTMIELVFVIVILGILAAVAVPKLAATRDDAKLATARTNLATCISDMGAKYTAQGSLVSTDLTNNPACSAANAYEASVVALNTSSDGLTVTTSNFSGFQSAYTFGGTSVSY